jgi:hypothetical protein
MTPDGPRNRRDYALRSNLVLLWNAFCTTLRRGALLSRGGSGVMEHEGLETHFRSGNQPRELEIEGKPIVLFRCPICERSFAREHGRSNWRAARVGTFRITYLSDSISLQWVSGPCPGKRQSRRPRALGAPGQNFKRFLVLHPDGTASTVSRKTASVAWIGVDWGSIGRTR